MDEHIKKLMEHAEVLKREILAAAELMHQAAKRRADEAAKDPCHHDTPLESKEVVVHAKSS